MIVFKKVPQTLLIDQYIDVKMSKTEEINEWNDIRQLWCDSEIPNQRMQLICRNACMSGEVDEA